MDINDTVSNGINQGSYIRNLAGDLLLSSPPGSEQGYVDASNLPRDVDWVKQSFLVTTDRNGKVMLEDQQISNRDFTSAMLKYTDASPGGNHVINPPPQFTRYADVRVPGIHQNAPVTAAPSKAFLSPEYVDIPMQRQVMYGQGRYYSEAIDDNNQVIHMCFGVAIYNSFAQFFTGFYDSGMASVARTGRLSGNFVERFLGFTGQLIGLAIAPLFIIPMAIMLLATAARFFLNTPPTKFYYMKPAMPAYWTAVTNLVNQIGTNMGLINYIDTRQSKAVTQGLAGAADKNGDRSMQKGVLAQYVPDGIMRDDGLIDVKKLVCRAKILEQKYQSIIKDVIESADPVDRWDETILGAINNARFAVAAESGAGESLEAYLTRHFNTAAYGKAADAPSSKGSEGSSTATTGSTAAQQGDNNGGTEMDLRSQAQADKKAGDTYDPNANSSFVDQVVDYFVANLADGSDWVSYRVDYTGAVSESFSNSVADSSLAQKINAMSSSNRDLRLNLADGNLIPGMGAVTDAVMSFVGGVARTIHIDGIAALAGSAFVDIPKHWDSSTANLTRSTYTMTLISPYGNPVSQMFNIYIPLATLLAGALPIATGAQSHTSPFLCELHDKGRALVRLGIIDSLSITRGTSNLGFNNQGQCMAVDVSFSVLDLSSIMAVPIMPGFDILNPLRGIFDSDNAFSDYLMSLASMPLGDTIYRFPMLKYQINRRLADYKSMMSPANIASQLASLPGINMLSAVMRGVSMQ